MVHTNHKTKLLYGDITAEEIVCWKPTDFLDEEKKLERQQAEDQNVATNRGDWAKEIMKKSYTDGLFECRNC